MASYSCITEMLVFAVEEAQTEAQITGEAHAVVEIPGELIAVPIDCALRPLLTVEPGDHRPARAIAEAWLQSPRLMERG